MTLDLSQYPEPEDYGEVLLRLMASPHRKPAPVFPGAETLPGAQPGDVLILVGETIPDLSGSLYAREWLGLQSSTPQIAPDAAQYESNCQCVIQSLIKQGEIHAAHGMKCGGLACALSDMAVSSSLGMHLVVDDSVVDLDQPYPELEIFSETGVQFLLSVPEIMTRSTQAALTEHGIRNTICGWVAEQTDMLEFWDDDVEGAELLFSVALSAVKQADAQARTRIPSRKR